MLDKEAIAIGYRAYNAEDTTKRLTLELVDLKKGKQELEAGFQEVLAENERLATQVQGKHAPT